jgi:hypothetical protein
MKSAHRKAERPTLSGARDALFRGASEERLTICDELPEGDVETELLRAHRIPPTTAPGGKDLQVTECFSKGRGLVPGALSSPAGSKVT